MRKMPGWTLPVLTAILLAACAAPPEPLPTPTPPPAVTLTPYTPPAPASSVSAAPTAAAQALPSPSPTPRTHTVVQGEDMFGIALRYGLTIDELKAANPDVNPNFLSIGAVLVVPASELAAPTPANPTPTPLPLQLAGPDCWPAADGSQTCLVLASNPGPGTLENLAVLVRTGTDSGGTAEEQAYGLLNLLPPGESLPLLVFFPASQTPGPRASVELLRAFPLPQGDARYAPVELRAVEIEIAANGLSAVVRGQAVAAGPQGARTAWIAAWGLDAQGRLVAARRWEAPAALAGGAAQPFSITLYSLGGPINAVETLAEATP